LVVVNNVKGIAGGDKTITWTLTCLGTQLEGGVLACSFCHWA